MIDDIDAKILNIIQQNARIANAEVARQLGMAPSAILERIRKLEAQGVIQSYETRLNARALGLGLAAFIFVRTNERAGTASTGALLAEIPAVQEVHHVAGEDCYLVKVRVADTEALGTLLRDEFSAIDAVLNTRSTIVLKTIKETSELPLLENGNA